MTNPAKVFSTYLSAFTGGDPQAAADCIADDFRFRGPFLQTDNKAAFLKGAAGLGPVVRGHRMLRQWEDGDEACSIYDFELETPKGKGAITMTEWVCVRDGKLVSSRLVFDTAKFSALMPD